MLLWLWLWLWLSGPRLQRRRAGEQARSGLRRDAQTLMLIESVPAQDVLSKTPPARREPEGRCAWGRLSFGDFSFPKKEKLLGRRLGGRNTAKAPQKSEKKNPTLDCRGR